jgi:hypothetical protein
MAISDTSAGQMGPNPSVAHTSGAWARVLVFAVLAAAGFFAAIVLSGSWQMVGAAVASLAVIAWAISFGGVLTRSERVVTARERAAPRPRVAHRLARSLGRSRGGRTARRG